MSTFGLTELNSSTKTDREITDYLFLLKEQLDYTLSNLDSSNFNYKFYEDLTVRVQNGLNIEGIVTFSALATNAETIINGAYIKTGIVEASNFKTYTYAESTETYGELLMYYQDKTDDPHDMAFLAGGIRMDDEGLGTDTSSRFRLWVYTQDIPESAFRVSLKLSSAYKASFEAVNNMYIACADDGQTAGHITIRASVIDLEGYVRVNGESIGG